VAWGRDRLVQLALRQRFLVTTDTEEGFNGVLTDWNENFFILEDAWSVAADGTTVKIDSALWLPRPRIKYMQAVAP
jgi:hypothetical protein